ncbi:hypothetical protein [Archangium lansingense]|uniref:Lipoprotein n=1 Tax=Archangium lansingense TaxID=2995310 RepID=A0ABT4ADV8_9BACT|nr:hypothetical protein [Archangium lansinium]MCY1079843.1 hypothetical protein [Archangium lansinium]
MRLLSALIPSVCFLVSACGGREEEDDALLEARQRLLGTYDVTGTLTIITNGVSSSQPASETLVLQSGTEREALTLELSVLGCTLRGKMLGERAFTLQSRTCALPPDDACTSTLGIANGSGSLTGDGLAVSLEAQRITQCGGPTTSRPITLTLSGPRRGRN